MVDGRIIQAVQPVRSNNKPTDDEAHRLVKGSPSCPEMAHLANMYRDAYGPDKNFDLAAILAYLAEPNPEPPPLPPLTTRRATSQQNLPPVRNLLTHPDDTSNVTKSNAEYAVDGGNSRVLRPRNGRLTLGCQYCAVGPNLR
jgi:hypothetical protein